MSQILDLTLKMLVIILLILIIPKILLPEALGAFFAKIEIGYEEARQNYLEDCDCTETLEKLQ